MWFITPVGCSAVLPGSLFYSVTVDPVGLSANSDLRYQLIAVFLHTYNYCYMQAIAWISAQSSGSFDSPVCDRRSSQSFFLRIVRFTSGPQWVLLFCSQTSPLAAVLQNEVHSQLDDWLLYGKYVQWTHMVVETLSEDPRHFFKFPLGWKYFLDE